MKAILFLSLLVSAVAHAQVIDKVKGLQYELANYFEGDSGRQLIVKVTDIYIIEKHQSPYNEMAFSEELMIDFTTQEVDEDSLRPISPIYRSRGCKLLVKYHEGSDYYPNVVFPITCSSLSLPPLRAE